VRYGRRTQSRRGKSSIVYLRTEKAGEDERKMKRIRHLQKQLCLTDQIIVESEDIFWYFFYFVFRDIYFRDITFSRYLFSR
jgi:hypothetical protein